MNKNLPTTSFIVLGLLSFGNEMSGYEIRKAAQNLQYFYWSPAQSQIYRELRRLEEHGSRHIKQVGKPDKQLFHINEGETAVFKNWLIHETLPPTMLKHPLMLKLYFGHMATPVEMVHMLQQFIENIKEQLGQLAIVEEFMPDKENTNPAAIVVEWGSHHCESELAMAQKLLARFEAAI